MKKYETLKKELERIAENDFIANLKKIASNEAVNNLETFEKREALALLQYAELAKALQNKKYTLVLDMNYAKCRAKEINFYRYSLLDTHNKRALHLYQHTSTFDICFSADKDTRAKVEAVEALNKSIFTAVADTTVFKKVHFDDMLDACKFALLLLESTLDEVKAYAEKQSDTKSTEE